MILKRVRLLIWETKSFFRTKVPTKNFYEGCVWGFLTFLITNTKNMDINGSSHSWKLVLWWMHDVFFVTWKQCGVLLEFYFTRNFPNRKKLASHPGSGVGRTEKDTNQTFFVGFLRKSPARAEETDKKQSIQQQIKQQNIKNSYLAII